MCAKQASVEVGPNANVYGRCTRAMVDREVKLTLFDEDATECGARISSATSHDRSDHDRRVEVPFDDRGDAAACIVLERHE